MALACPRANLCRAPDVRLREGSLSQFAQARVQAATGRDARDWFHSRRLANGARYLRWSRLFEFLISPDGSQIRYRRLGQASNESFSVYLLGQVLSFSLLAFGIESLHATVVVVGSRAVAFLGGCGSGKSTLAAALVARGFGVLTDDLAALDEAASRWTVHPGIPRLKLFPSVARKLLGRHDGTPMNNGTTKQVLALGHGHSVRQDTPLAAIYVLSRPQSSRARARAGVIVERLSGSEAFMEIIAAAFNLMVVDRARLANQFAFAKRLVASVPVRRLTYPRTLAVLPEVCDTLLADLKATVPARSGGD